MKQLKRKTIGFLIISMFAIMLLLSTTNAQTTQPAIQKLLDYINHVAAIDSFKFFLTGQTYSYSYPSTYGGLVKEELATLTLNSSDGSGMHVLCIFANGFIYSLFLSLYGPVADAQQYSVGTIEKAYNMITRYQTFATTNNINNDHVTPALSMLSRVEALSTSSIIEGNIKMRITCSPSTIEDSTLNSIKIAWVYTNKGVDASRKSLSIGFEAIKGGVKITFGDVWGLWSVADSGISKDEATSIAWSAAKDYNIKLRNTKDNSTTFVTPDWGDAPFIESSLMMAPGQSYNNSKSIALNLGSMGKTARNGLTLYPLWQFMFHFNKSLGDIQGIQVGIWSDTNEIAYCTEFGVYGVVTTPSPAPQQTTPTQSTYSSNDALCTMGVAGVIAIGTTIMIGAYFKRHKR